MNSQARDVAVILLKAFGCLFVVVAFLTILFPIFAGYSGHHHGPYSSCLSNMNQIAKAMLSYCGDYDDKFPCTRAPGVANGMQPELGIEARQGVVPFGGATWVERIDPYLQKGSIVDAPKGKMGGVLNCPEREKKWPKGVGQDIRDWHSYGYNFLFLGLPWDADKAPKTNPYHAWKFATGVRRVSRLENTSDTILLVESRSIWAFPPYTKGGRVVPANRTCISPRHGSDDAAKVNVAFCDGHVKAMDPCELVATGRPLKIKGTIGAATDNRLWDPVKSKYPPEPEEE